MSPKYLFSFFTLCFKSRHSIRCADVVAVFSRPREGGKTSEISRSTRTRFNRVPLRHRQLAGHFFTPSLRFVIPEMSKYAHTFFTWTFSAPRSPRHKKPAAGADPLRGASLAGVHLYVYRTGAHRCRLALDFERSEGCIDLTIFSSSIFEYFS